MARGEGDRSVQTELLIVTPKTPASEKAPDQGSRAGGYSEIPDADLGPGPMKFAGGK